MHAPQASASADDDGVVGPLEAAHGSTPAATSTIPATCHADVAAPRIPALTTSTSTGAEPRASG